MKKTFNLYVVIWTILLALFNVIVFVVRPLIPNHLETNAIFWISWGLVIATFIGNLGCAVASFKGDNPNKKFYNIPLISSTFIAMILTLIFGSVLMIIPNCPAWISAVICIIILAVCLFFILKAKVASDIVSEIDSNVKEKTHFIKSKTIDAQLIMEKAKSEQSRALCKKVYDALRYSDPTSNDELSQIETEIMTKIKELSESVNENNEAKVTTVTNEILLLIKERNSKCKAVK